MPRTVAILVSFILFTLSGCGVLPDDFGEVPSHITDTPALLAEEGEGNFFVHRGGHDDNFGTKEEPFDTIQRGINAASFAGGGNVCAVAQKRAIAGFAIDGVIRDVGEIRQMRFPVFARGLMPIPGEKKVSGPLNTPIECGGVCINPGDPVVADEEGIVVILVDQADAAYEKAKAKLEKEESWTLDEWRRDHQAKINQLMQQSDS